MRATSETLAPGSSDAATSRSFSSCDHRRRRSTDVITSALEIVIALLLGLPLGPAAFASVKQGGPQRRNTAEWTQGEANPRFVVTSLRRVEAGARQLYEDIYCARGDMENRIKECQLDLYADRTSAQTMRANQLRLWFAAMAYVLICAMRRIALADTAFANATCGTIRLKFLKIGALVRISVRRIKIAMASACPAAEHWGHAVPPG
jgi:Transposase DDE domain group 1